MDDEPLQGYSDPRDNGRALTGRRQALCRSARSRQARRIYVDARSHRSVAARSPAVKICLRQDRHECSTRCERTRSTARSPSRDAGARNGAAVGSPPRAGDRRRRPNGPESEGRGFVMGDHHGGEQGEVELTTGLSSHSRCNHRARHRSEPGVLDRLLRRAHLKPRGRSSRPCFVSSGPCHLRSLPYRPAGIWCSTALACGSSPALDGTEHIDASVWQSRRRIDENETPTSRARELYEETISARWNTRRDIR